jgi:excisionase family DNA binding protein
VSERLVDAQAVAERLGVPVSWVREQTRSGAMPCVELGRYRRYDLDDVAAWLEACKRPGRPVAFRSVSPNARANGA